MRVEYLEYFIDFSETLSITKTARRHFMSYQGMSRALHELEKEVGEPLFAYSGRNVELSHFGKDYVSIVRPVVNEYKIAKKRTFQMKELLDEKKHERLFVLFTPVAGRCILPLLSKHYPFHSYLHFDEASHEEIGDKVRGASPGKSIGVITMPGLSSVRERLLERLTIDDMQSIPFASSSVVVLLSEHSPYARNEVFKHSDLARCQVGCLSDAASVDMILESVDFGNLYISGVWEVLVGMVSADRIVMPVPRLVLARVKLPSDIVVLPLVGDGDKAAGPEFSLLIPDALKDDDDVVEFAYAIEDLFNSPVLHDAYPGYFSAPGESIQ